MVYPDESKLRHLLEQLFLYGQFKHDYGSPNVEAVLTKEEQALQPILEELQALHANS